MLVKICLLIITVYQKTKNSASEFLWVQKSSNINEEIQDNTDPVSKLKI